MQKQSLQRIHLKPRGDKVIRLQISRNTLIAFIVSILVHGLVLFFVAPLMPENQALPPPSAFNVSLAPKPAAATPAEPLPVPEVAPEPPIEQKPEKKIEKKTQAKTQGVNKAYSVSAKASIYCAARRT